MKKYNLYKDWNLMTIEEQEKFKKDLLDDYLEDANEDIDTYNQNDFEEYCQRVNSDYYFDDFGEKYSNLSTSPLANQKVAVTGVLGLWYGKRIITPKVFEDLSKAIAKCLEDYNEIYEDQYGNLHIEAHHHDGMNHFIIKKATDKGLRCLHFRREVFGA